MYIHQTSIYLFLSNLLFLGTAKLQLEKNMLVVYTSISKKLRAQDKQQFEAENAKLRRKLDDARERLAGIQADLGDAS